MKTNMRVANIVTFILFGLSLTSCATKFEKYQQQVRFNNMQCQKMCSSGNVVQIEKFNCVCNLNKNSGKSDARSYSSSNGNTVNVYTQRGPNIASKPISNPWAKIMGTLIQNERDNRARTQNTLNNWGGGRVDSSQDINRGYQNVIPQNNVFGVIGE